MIGFLVLYFIVSAGFGAYYLWHIHTHEGLQALFQLNGNAFVLWLVFFLWTVPFVNLLVITFAIWFHVMQWMRRH